MESKKQKATVVAAEAGPKQQVVDPFNKFSHCLWDLPDYVSVEDNTTLTCTLCKTKLFSAVQQCYMHLGGKSHASKCCEAKLEEVMYVMQRDRLEYVLSGSAVIRTNHIKPKIKLQ